MLLGSVATKVFPSPGYVDDIGYASNTDYMGWGFMEFIQSTETTFFLSVETMYLGKKSPSTLTPNSLEGRSAMCPKLEATL